MFPHIGNQGILHKNAVGEGNLDSRPSGYEADSTHNDFNDLGYLAYQNVVKCVKSYVIFAPQVHPVFERSLHRDDPPTS